MDGKPRKRADWFPVYLSQRQYIDKVDDATAGRVLKAALTYLATGELVPLTPVEDILFTAFKDNIDDAIVRFQRKCKANAENAQKRWLKKLPTDTNGSESMPFAPNGSESMPTDAHIELQIQTQGEGDIQSSPAPASKNFSGDQRVYDHDSDAYGLAEYFAKEKLVDFPGRAQPTERDLQKWAQALQELHEENKVKWAIMKGAMNFALDSEWWSKRVQPIFDFKKNFNKLFVEAIQERGYIPES